MDGSSLLDNTLVVWTYEISMGGHTVIDHPVVTFGDAQGAIRTGNFIHYGDRPINQLGVTVMKAMGLSESEYSSYGDGGGFGQFNPSFTQYGNINQRREKQYGPYKPERNKPLPFLWKG